MISYYRPIVTLCLKCTVFEIWRQIGRKSPKNPPHSHLSRSLGVTPCKFFDESYLARKWNHIYGTIRWWTFHDPAFALLVTIPAVTRGQTDRQTCCCRKDRAMHIVARVKCLTSSEKLVLSKIRFVLSLKKCSRFVVVLVRDRPCLTHSNSRCSIKDGCNIKTFREYTVPESNYIGVTLLVLYLIKRVRQYLP